MFEFPFLVFTVIFPLSVSASPAAAFAPSEQWQRVHERSTEKLDVSLFQIDKKTSLLALRQKAFSPSEIRKALDEFRKGGAQVKSVKAPSGECLQKSELKRTAWACADSKSLLLIALQSESASTQKAAEQDVVKSLLK